MTFLFKKILYQLSSFSCQNARQHFGIDIPSADYSRNLTRFGQFAGMKESRCRGHSAAGLGDDPDSAQDTAHGFPNLIFTDRYDIIYKFHDVREGNFSYRIGAQAIGDGAIHLFGGKCHPLFLMQAGLRIAGQLRLNPDDFYPGTALLNGGSNAADESASADRD